MPHTNPLEGWRGIAAFESAPIPDAIRRDALAYFRTMPPSERPNIEDMGPTVTYR